MKEGWEYKKLGDLVFFDKRFKGIPRDEQKKIVSFKHVSAETLKGMSVDEGCIKLLSTGLFSGFTTEEIAGDNLNEGEVVTIPTGGNANLKYYKGKFVDSGNILCVAKDDNIYLKFLHYKLLEQNEYIESCFKGTGIHHPFMPDIWNVMIPVPNIAEQQRIVNRLDAAFVKTDSMKANAEKALNEAKALFQASLKEMLEPKDGWEEKTLGEMSEIQSGFAFKSTQFQKRGEFQVIRMGNVRPGIIRYNESPVFIDSVDKNTIEKALLKVGDIIITQTGSRNKRDYGFTVLIDKEKLLLNQRIARIRVINTITNKYLLYYSWTDYFRDQYFANEGGTVGQGNVGIDAIRYAVISHPPLSEQQSIVETLDSLKSKVDRLQANYDKISQECDALKQAILRQVFE